MIHKIPNWLVICIVVRLCLIFVHCGDDDNKNNGKKKEDKEEQSKNYPQRQKTADFRSLRRSASARSYKQKDSSNLPPVFSPASTLYNTHQISLQPRKTISQHIQQFRSKEQETSTGSTQSESYFVLPPALPLDIISKPRIKLQLPSLTVVSQILSPSKQKPKKHQKHQKPGIHIVKKGKNLPNLPQRKDSLRRPKQSISTTMSPTKSITSQVLTDSNNGPASSSDFIDTTTQQNNDASFTPEYGYIKQQPHMPDQGFMMVQQMKTKIVERPTQEQMFRLKAIYPRYWSSLSPATPLGPLKWSEQVQRYQAALSRLSQAHNIPKPHSSQQFDTTGSSAAGSSSVPSKLLDRTLFLSKFPLTQQQKNQKEISMDQVLRENLDHEAQMVAKQTKQLFESNIFKSLLIEKPQQPPIPPQRTNSLRNPQQTQMISTPIYSKEIEQMSLSSSQWRTSRQKEKQSAAEAKLQTKEVSDDSSSEKRQQESKSKSVGGARRKLFTQLRNSFKRKNSKKRPSKKEPQKKNQQQPPH